MTNPSLKKFAVLLDQAVTQSNGAEFGDRFRMTEEQLLELSNEVANTRVIGGFRDLMKDAKQAGLNDKQQALTFGHIILALEVHYKTVQLTNGRISMTEQEKMALNVHSNKQWLVRRFG